MADLALDNAGDLLVTNNALTLVDGDDAVRQNVDIRLQFFLGEWSLDTRQGIPYYRDILVKNPNYTLIQGIFRKAILTTPGISTLEKFELSYDNTTRALSVDFTARRSSDNGLLDYSKEFIL